MGLRGSEVTEVCKKLRNNELNDLYCSPNIIRVIKSIRMRWTEHVACMGDKRVVSRVLVVKPEGKRTLENPGVDGRIIIRWIFKSGMWEHGLN